LNVPLRILYEKMTSAAIDMDKFIKEYKHVYLYLQNKNSENTRLSRKFLDTFSTYWELVLGISVMICQIVANFLKTQCK
jgi:succinate dehydrogenase/fumarate reductase-like Fe-S protein